MTALEMARRVAAGEVSSLELVRDCLDRIEEHEGLSAFTSVMRRRALREAAAPRPGPFSGVPIGVKDLDIVGGTYTRFGSRAYRWFWSPADGPVARRLREAGFILVGKLATSEFGAMPVTEPDIHPPTRNPWNPDHSPGGSSGGSAAAVAAGIFPLAQGSDGGGSIRIPASFCGIFGFKPSRAAVRNPYGRADPCGIAYVGPLARSVADAAAFVDVLAGTDLLAACELPPERLRVRYTTASTLGATDPEVAGAVLAIARLLADAGHDVSEGAGMQGDLDEFLPIWQRQLASLPVWSESMVQPVTRWLRAGGRRHTLAECLQRRDELRERVVGWFGDADIWLTATVPEPAPRVGASAGMGPEETFRWAARIGPNTAPFNLSGHPAASVPVAVSSTGLPIGVQVVGRDDAVVLKVCRQIEQMRGWPVPSAKSRAASEESSS